MVATLELQAAIGGRVVVPGDRGWDRARQAWQLNVDQQPTAIAVPEDERDVVAIVDFARHAGLRVAPQATGHNANALGSLAGTILVKTSALRGVRIDAERRRARVAAGAVWEDVAVRAGRLAALHGSSPVVGVVGFSLGGGIGFYSRRHGLQANHITAAEIVTADGRLRRVDDDRDPELLWALRGGGGNFGVVTALEFGLFAPRELHAGVFAWDWREARRVLGRWAEWAVAAPESVTTSARLLQLPARGTVPWPLRGRRIVIISGAVLGSAAVLEPLRRLKPELDTFAAVPPAAVLRIHGDAERPTPLVTTHLLLGELPAEAVDAFVEEAGPESGSSLRLAELRQLGGALSRPSVDTAMPALEGAFLLHASTVVADEASTAAGLADLERLRSALEPWSNGRAYLNWAHSFDGRRFDPRTIYDEPAYRRLAALRARVDPAHLFQAIHPIG